MVKLGQESGTAQVRRSRENSYTTIDDISTTKRVVEENELPRLPFRSFQKALDPSSTTLPAVASSLGSCTSDESIFNATNWDGHATRNHSRIGPLERKWI